MSYKRLRDKSDRTNFGTDNIVTSGDNVTGTAIFTQDYSLHTYQAFQVGSGPHVGEFSIQISNDGTNYTTIAAYDIGTSGVAYSDTWGFAYARPVITGTNGDFVVNEVHLK